MVIFFKIFLPNTIVSFIR